MPKSNKAEELELLEEIRDNTATPWWRTLSNGLFYGAGITIGTVLAIAALGWLLSVFGVIPGLDQIVAYLQQILNQKL